MSAPARRDRTRPVELIGLSAILGVFTFLIVFMGTREPLVALEFAGVAFIVGLVGLAMLALTSKPNEDEKHDLDEQNKDEGAPPSFH
jgi:amino acid transporter